MVISIYQINNPVNQYGISTIIAEEASWQLLGACLLYTSTPFADSGIPALSFARIASSNVAPIHCRYDVKAVSYTHLVLYYLL